MIIELVIMGAVGIVFIIFGLLIWKKEKITLIHNYHHKNVKPEGVPTYTTINGKATVLTGIGCLSTGIVDFATTSGLGWIIFAICFAVSVTLFHYAQKKYNGGW